MFKPKGASNSPGHSGLEGGAATTNTTNNNTTINALIIQNAVIVNSSESDLKSIRDVLKHIHSTLYASFAVAVERSGIPILLYHDPTTIIELKMNIDKYLQRAFAVADGEQDQAKYLCYQYVSDYLVGNKLSKPQISAFFTTENTFAINTARMIFAFFQKHHTLKDTVLRELWEVASSFRGTKNLDDDFLTSAVDF